MQRLGLMRELSRMRRPQDATRMYHIRYRRNGRWPYHLKPREVHHLVQEGTEIGPLELAGLPSHEKPVLRVAENEVRLWTEQHSSAGTRCLIARRSDPDGESR
jgi:hypothetical protein